MAKSELTPTGNVPVSRPRDVFAAMRDELDRVFHRFENGWPQWPSLLRVGNGNGAMLPQFDVREDGKSITVEAELPGVAEKDIAVTLANGMLTIKGEKKDEREEKGDTYYVSERSFGSFERSLRLPDTIDESKVDARFDKGVLKVTMQKRPEAVKAAKKIEIKSN